MRRGKGKDLEKRNRKSPGQNTAVSDWGLIRFLVCRGKANHQENVTAPGKVLRETAGNHGTAEPDFPGLWA